MVWRSKHRLTAYRISSAAHPLPDGAGAAASDAARWNSRGRFGIYAAEHYATALLEKAAQLNSARIPRSLRFTKIDLPAGITVEELRTEDLPGWDADDRSASQAFGNSSYDDARSLILFVPSLAAPAIERNVLIHQHHPQFDKIRATVAVSVRCHPRLVI